MVEILCYVSTSCKETGYNNDYHRSRQRQTSTISIKSMGLILTISFIVLPCIMVKLSFLFVALYLALYAGYKKMCQKVH